MKSWCRSLAVDAVQHAPWQKGRPVGSTRLAVALGCAATHRGVWRNPCTLSCMAKGCAWICLKLKLSRRASNPQVRGHQGMGHTKASRLNDLQLSAQFSSKKMPDHVNARCGKRQTFLGCPAFVGCRLCKAAGHSLTHLLMPSTELALD